MPRAVAAAVAVAVAAVAASIFAASNVLTSMASTRRIKEEEVEE